MKTTVYMKVTMAYIYVDGDCDDVCDVVIVPQVGRTGRVNYDYALLPRDLFPINHFQIGLRV